MPEEKSREGSLTGQNLTQEELLRKIYENTEKTRKYLMWNRIFSIIKIAVIVIPLILAIMYLPPLLENVFAPYKELLNTTQEGKNMLESLDINSLLKMYK
ncbi:hypothetical protein KKA66_01990 [Patescibacteria group bacterium]|nr:hypothetical protein [Patescibacteria group bacterium]